MIGHPKGWKLTTLAEIARWGSGGTPRAGNSKYYGGTFPWAVIGDLDDNILMATARSITEAGLRESSAKLVPKGALLIAMYGASIGKLGITGQEMATNQAIAFAIPDSCKIELRYLFYYLMHQRNALVAAGKGAAQPNISQTTLKAWPIALAPLAEQRRIVGILDDHLSRLDASVSELEHAVRRIDILEAQTIRAVLTDRAVAGPHDVQIRAVGMDDGELATLPRGWCWMRLGEFADVVGGVTKDSNKQSDPSFVEVPYLRVANVQRGHLDLRKITTIRIASGRAEALQLLPGDVLLNEGGDRDKLGRGWVWEGQIENCIHQNHVFRARARDGQIDPYLLSWAANSIGGRWCERNGKQSVNLASISLSKIRLMPVPVPPPNEQAALRQHIESVIDGCRIMHSEITTSRTRSMALRRSLLEAAFSGRLTGSTRDIEMAEEKAGV